MNTARDAADSIDSNEGAIANQRGGFSLQNNLNGSAAALLGLFLASRANAEEAQKPTSLDVSKDSIDLPLLEAGAQIGVGANTLDSATAELNGGAFYGALDTYASFRPLPFKDWNGLYLGVDADARFADGWGLSDLEGVIGYDQGRIALDLGVGTYWDVLDGNRPNTNMDGVPHVSIDLRVQPFHESSKLHPLVVGASWGTTLPQGGYLHPAFMDAHVAVGAEFDLKWPNISSGTRVKAESAPQNEVSAHFNVRTRPLKSKLLLPTGMPDDWERSELRRLTEEMHKLAARTAWPAVETDFQKLIAGDRLKDLPLTHQAYMDGAEAARALGDMTAAYERVRLAGLADGKVEQAWLAEVEANYAYVELKESLPGNPEFICTKPPFAPDARAAYVVIVDKVNASGHYEGLLPLEAEFSWGGVPLPVLKPLSVAKEVQVITLEK